MRNDALIAVVVGYVQLEMSLSTSAQWTIGWNPLQMQMKNKGTNGELGAASDSDDDDDGDDDGWVFTLVRKIC